jgi:hypothetical protein
MKEKDRIKYDEKVVLQDEVMDCKEVMLEEEIYQIQKSKDSKISESVIVLPSERTSISEVEGANSENDNENAEKGYASTQLRSFMGLLFKMSWWLLNTFRLNKKIE